MHPVGFDPWTSHHCNYKPTLYQLSYRISTLTQLAEEGYELITVSITITISKVITYRYMFKLSFIL